MNNKVTKNLIILGIFVFSFILAGSAQAAYNPYDSSYWLMPVSNNSIDDYTGSYTYYNSYQTTDRNNNGTSTTSSTVKPTTINNYNYYYQNDPSTTAKTNTTTKTTTNNTTTDKTTANTYDQVAYQNSLGGSAYTGYNSYNGYDQTTGNRISALSLRGSGGFMPSSIWQWIIVIILILVIIIISRVLINKRKHSVQEVHTVHTH